MEAMCSPETWVDFSPYLTAGCYIPDDRTLQEFKILFYFYGVLLKYP
jgi:hypothetical protein